MALDLGTLSAKIKLDGLEEYIKGLEEAEKASKKQTEEEKKQSEQRRKAIEQAKKAQQALNTINKYQDKVWSGVKTGAKAAIGAVSSLTAGMVALGKKSIDAYAKTEQMYGGVQKIFGDDAAKVIENANKAFETAGLSANDYMENVTSFSASLLQSVGKDTKKAAEIADVAMRDMSDNANMYGTNIQDIQNAYQGFAKQNYTMLDNLKLGYGGTKTEMERLLSDANKINKKAGKTTQYSIDSLADIMNAIHTVQEAQNIAGTTQKEAAKTIEGSINSAKAAWENLLAGFADPDANLDTLTDNFLESLNNVIDNVEPAIGRITDSLDDNLPQILDKLEPIFDDIIDLTLDTLVEAADMVIDNAPELLEKITSVVFKILSKTAEEAPALVFAGVAAAIAKVGSVSATVAGDVKELYGAFKTLKGSQTSGVTGLIGSTAGKAGLYGLAIAATVAVAALAIDQWNKYQEKLRKTADVTTNFRNRLDSTTDSLNDNSSALGENTDTYEDWLDAQQEHIKNTKEAYSDYETTATKVKDLTEKINKLTKKKSLDKDETKELNGYIDQFNELTGDNIEHTDGSKKSVDELRKSVAKLGDEYLQTAYKQAQSKQIEENYEAINETQKQLQEVEKQQQEAFSDFQSANQDGRTFDEDMAYRRYAQATEKVNTLKQALQNYKTENDQVSKSLALSNQKMQETVTNSDALKAAANNMGWSYVDLANKLSQYGVSVGKAKKLTQEEATAIMQMNTNFAGMKGVTKGIKTLVRAGVSMKSLTSLSKEQMKKVLETLNSGAKDAPDKAKKLVNNYAKGIESKKDKAKQAAKTVKDSACNGMEADGSNASKGTKYGDDFGNGYVLGIGSKKQSAYDAAYALGQAGAKGLQDGQKSSSPSKITRELGNDFGDGYWLGIQDKESEAVSAAYNLSDIAANSLTAMPNLSSIGAVDYAQTTGDVYYITVDDNVINDTPAIKKATKDYIKMLARKGMM